MKVDISMTFLAWLPLQKLVGDFFFDFGEGNFAGNLTGILWDFWAHKLGCRKWGCNKWGLKGWVWPAFLEVGRNRPKSPFFCLFRPFPEGAKSTWEIQKTKEKGFLRYPRISLNPHLLNPHLRHSKQNKGSKFRGKFRSIFREKIRVSKKSFVPTSFCRRATLRLLAKEKTS